VNRGGRLILDEVVPPGRVAKRYAASLLFPRKQTSAKGCFDKTGVTRGKEKGTHESKKSFSCGAEKKPRRKSLWEGVKVSRHSRYDWVGGSFSKSRVRRTRSSFLQRMDHKNSSTRLSGEISREIRIGPKCSERPRGQTEGNTAGRTRRRGKKSSERQKGHEGLGKSRIKREKSWKE